jgi:uncharacterized protein with GYD domain
MPVYLFTSRYRPDALVAQMRTPQDRVEATRKPVEKLGGRIISAWHAIGEVNFVAIIELPSDQAIASLAIAFTAGGAAEDHRWIRLMSSQDWVEAVQGAATTEYRPATAVS